VITALPRIAIAARDFDAILATFRDALGMPVVDLSPHSAASLGARLAMCVPPGGSHIELMSPADPAAPLAQSLERFLARRTGLFALMLEAPDPDTEAEALRARGLDVLPNMAGAGGRDLHPRSTHGVLIRVYPCDSFRAASEAVQHNAARALGLSGIARVVVAVRDAKRAHDVYRRGIGLAAEEPVEDAARGVVSVRCAAPQGAAIELVEPRDPRRHFATAIAEHLDARGEGLFALVLRAPNPKRAAAALTARGLAARPFADDDACFELEPALLFGARVVLSP
jgi:catechol 2,3-dioxygenase-like lactoylglutathione lyase family enzyme